MSLEIIVGIVVAIVVVIAAVISANKEEKAAESSKDLEQMISVLAEKIENHTLPIFHPSY
ncbi:MAG: hypothetical protein R3Y07_10800 [Eubacteriales bacterium]